MGIAVSTRWLRYEGGDLSRHRNDDESMVVVDEQYVLGFQVRVD